MDPWITLRRRELGDECPAGVAEDIHFPERLAERVIGAFSSPGEVVLDPFAGFGTTAAVAIRMGRRAIALELLPERTDLIRRRIGDAALVITGDARELSRLVREPVDLCFTSPPYMTRGRHLENPLTGYRTLDGHYRTYLDELELIFGAVVTLLRPGGHLVINAATIVAEDGVTPLADDIADRVSRHVVRRADLRIAWDATPPGVVDDRCMVFEKADAGGDSVPAKPQAQARGSALGEDTSRLVTPLDREIPGRQAAVMPHDSCTGEILRRTGDRSKETIPWPTTKSFSPCSPTRLPPTRPSRRSRPGTRPATRSS